MVAGAGDCKQPEAMSGHADSVSAPETNLAAEGLQSPREIKPQPFHALDPLWSLGISPREDFTEDAFWCVGFHFLKHQLSAMFTSAEVWPSLTLSQRRSVAELIGLRQLLPSVVGSWQVLPTSYGYQWVITLRIEHLSALIMRTLRLISHEDVARGCISLRNVALNMECLPMIKSLS